LAVAFTAWGASFERDANDSKMTDNWLEHRKPEASVEYGQLWGIFCGRDRRLTST